jgi:hypothetical protein
MREGINPGEKNPEHIIDIIQREISIVTSQEIILHKAFAKRGIEPVRIERVIAVGMPGVAQMVFENDPIAEDFAFSDPEEFLAQRPRTRMSYVYNAVGGEKTLPTPIFLAVPVMVEEMITAEADDNAALHLYHATRDTEGKIYKDDRTAAMLKGENEWGRKAYVQRLVNYLLKAHPPRS